jgi:hypothetical protein
MNGDNLQNEFNASAQGLQENVFTKVNDVCLLYYAGKSHSYSGVHMWIDFLARKTIIGDKQTVIKFSDDDRDTLEFMRNKLIQLGGNPPPLTNQQPATPAPKFRKPEA